LLKVPIGYASDALNREGACRIPYHALPPFAAFLPILTSDPLLVEGKTQKLHSFLKNLQHHFSLFF